MVTESEPQMIRSESFVVDRVAAYLRGRDVEVWPVTTPEAIREAELSLGFALPDLLKRLYLNVGNGWAAPGYGFIGVAGGRPSNLGDLATTYREVMRGAQYLKRDWAKGLLPFCEWGCNIFSCVDCLDAATPVHRSDECVSYAEGYTMAEFLTMWMDGVGLLD